MAAMFYCLFVSLSPFLRLHISETEHYILLILIFSLLVARAIIDRLIRSQIVIIVLSLLSFISLQLIVSDMSSKQLMLSFVRLLIIPITAYYSVFYIRLNKKKISDVFLPYFIVNLFILYYRSFVDYSFFGAIRIFEGFEQLYSVGGVLYRPSNLSSPIIFSVELAVFLAVVLHEQGRGLKFFLLSGISIVPFILMRSRSGLVLLIFLIVTKLLSGKKFRTILLAASLLAILILMFGQNLYILSVFDFAESSYVKRGHSILEALQTIGTYEVKYLLLGKGSGSANTYMSQAGSSYELYVENFFISILNDYGIVFNAILIFFTIYVITLTLTTNIYNKERSFFTFAFMGILLTNFLASNLSLFTVQMIYWVTFFMSYVRESYEHPVFKR